MSFNKILNTALSVMFLLSGSAIAGAPEEFATFDGRVYNGRFYPRIDIIEWSDTPAEQSHMEFHVYSKNKPVDMGFQLDTTTGKPVMKVRYLLKDRNEYVCRRVLAPGHFKEKFFIYRDLSDPEFDNTVVSATKIEKPNLLPLDKPMQYADCKEEDPEKATAQDNTNPNAAPAQPAADNRQDQRRPAAAGNGNAAPAEQDPGAAFTKW